MKAILKKITETKTHRSWFYELNEEWNETLHIAVVSLFPNNDKLLSETYAMESTVILMADESGRIYDCDELQGSFVGKPCNATAMKNSGIPVVLDNFKNKVKLTFNSRKSI